MGDLPHISLQKPLERAQCAGTNVKLKQSRLFPPCFLLSLPHSLTKEDVVDVLKTPRHTLVYATSGGTHCTQNVERSPFDNAGKFPGRKLG